MLRSGVMSSKTVVASVGIEELRQGAPLNQSDLGLSRGVWKEESQRPSWMRSKADPRCAVHTSFEDPEGCYT